MYKIIVLTFVCFVQWAVAGETMSYVQYDNKHIEVVKAGVSSITSFYENNGIAEKRSFLFCLDKYLDPYYKYDLPYADQIFYWLNTELEKTAEVELKEDILQLLQGYSNYDYLDCAITGDGKIDCNKAED